MSQFVNLDSLIGRHHWLFDLDFPISEIISGDQSTNFLRPPGKLFGDVALVEAFVGSIDSFFPVLANSERFFLSFD